MQTGTTHGVVRRHLVTGMAPGLAPEAVYRFVRSVREACPGSSVDILILHSPVEEWSTEVRCTVRAL